MAHTNHRARGARGLSAALIIALLAGCGGSSPPLSSHVAADQSSLLDYYITDRTGAAADRVAPELRQGLSRDLSRLQAAAALAENIPGARHRAELARLEAMARAAATSSGVDTKPSDNVLRAEYRRFVATQPTIEYRVAHILVPTESAAAGIVLQLEKGEDFATLARTTSADDSRPRGGELGWIFVGHMPSAFVDAVKQLKIGEYTRQPVQTPYGWHVIRLLETRTTSPPALGDVKAQLIANIQQDRYAGFLDEALAKVTIRPGASNEVSSLPSK